MRRVAMLVFVGCAAFLLALVARTKANKSAAESAPGVDAPDSVQLAALGVYPGRQLVAYVFGGSHCGYCNKPETKQAFRALREALTHSLVETGQYSVVRVVGVAVDGDVQQGLAYLNSVGTDAFSEISTGSGWQNEHVVRLMRQENVAKLAVPAVVVVSRPMTATLSPLTLRYGRDTVMKVVQGSSRIAEWVRAGAGLDSGESIPVRSGHR